MVRILEEGDIFFCYRPKVDVARVRGLADIQRFHVILKPGSKDVFRRVVVGRKRLPDIAARERTWGFVDLVTTSPEEIEDEFDPESYETRTRGRRLVQAARPVGEGVYAIVSHENHTHLAYALELPETPGPAQAELNIGAQASFIVTVRNPDMPAPPQAGMPTTPKPRYPEELRRKFADRTFTDLDPPDFLDHPGTELVLIGAATDVHRELGLSLHPRRETEETAGIFTTLRMERDVHPLKPLLTGEWE
jgi:hypothetical protein